METTYFTQYKPEKPKFGEFVLYLQDESGNDWYDTQSKFKAETVKIAVNRDGRIVCVDKDISKICPTEMKVVELDQDSLPQGFDIFNDYWQYSAGSVSIRKDAETLSIINCREKTRLMAMATERISVLSDAVELGDNKERDADKLLAWRKFRVEVNAIDVTKETKWPIAPEA